MNTYDRRAFARAYADAQRTRVDGIDGERVGYAGALKEHRAALLAGLERLFDLRLDMDSLPSGTKALFMLFRGTVRSYVDIKGPGDGFLEAGLLHKAMENAGIDEAVGRDLDSIRALNEQSRTTHLDILTTLLGAMLGDNADRVVSEADLRAIGVNPIPPNPNDYDW